MRIKAEYKVTDRNGQQLDLKELEADSEPEFLHLEGLLYAYFKRQYSPDYYVFRTSKRIEAVIASSRKRTKRK